MKKKKLNKILEKKYGTSLEDLEGLKLLKRERAIISELAENPGIKKHLDQMYMAYTLSKPIDPVANSPVLASYDLLKNYIEILQERYN